MVYRPDAVVAIDPEVLGDSVRHLCDRAAGSVFLRGGVAIIDAVVRQVRLPVPAASNTVPSREPAQQQFQIVNKSQSSDLAASEFQVGSQPTRSEGLARESFTY